MTTVKSQTAANGGTARAKNSAPASSNPPATSSQSSSPVAPVPAPAPAASTTPTPAPPAAPSNPTALPPSDAESTSILAAVELEALAAAQANATQVSSTAASSAPPASATTPASKDTTDAGNVVAPNANVEAVSSSDAAAIAMPAASADTSTTNADGADQPASKVLTLAPALGAQQLTQVAQRLRTPAELGAATPPLAGIPAKAPNPTPPTPPVAPPKQTISPELLASITGNAAGNTSLSAPRTPSEAQNQITQDAASKLQGALNLPEIKAIPTASGNAASGGNSTGNGTNQSSQDSDNSGPTAPATNLTQILAASQSATAPDGSEKIQSTDSAVAVKAAGLTAVSVDQGLRVPADAPGAPAWADAGSSAPPTSKESIPVTTTPPPPAPAPVTLPASLSAVAQASQLYQRVGGAEMHIALQTDLLGSIDLHTVVHQSTISATIGVQRADVQSLLANDLPALQHALAEQRFQVNQISVLNNSVGGRLDQSGEQQQQQHQNGSPPSSAPVPVTQEFSRGSGEESAPAWSEVSVLGEYAGQLSIRV